jgi:SP family sugar porter-like MFS transporter
MSVGVSALWIGCFALTVSFKPINTALGPAKTFWMYAGICLVGFIVMLWRLPETKGKSLEAIERELG